MTGAAPLNATAAVSARSTNGQTVRAIEGVVTALFSALRAANYAAACNDYTPQDRAVIVAAATKIAGKTFTACAPALAAIYRATPTMSGQFHDLGLPHYSNLKVDGSTATLTYSSTVGKLVAHSEIIVDHEAGGWLVGQATSLTFTKR